MTLTRRRASWLPAAAIGAGAAAAFALPAGAAVSLQSQSPPVQAVSLGDQATLDANGAVVFAPVKVVCAPGTSAWLTVTVAENVGGFIASGSASQQVDLCSGTTQQLTVAVIPSQRAFRKGVAFGQATLNFCDFNGCHNAVDQHNIEIVKK
jgi:hypothetical protein